jgi:hypothetical protein
MKSDVATYGIQRAVLRDCGSNPADNAVQISELLPRRKFSGSRHYAKPPTLTQEEAEVKPHTFCSSVLLVVIFDNS